MYGAIINGYLLNHEQMSQYLTADESHTICSNKEKIVRLTQAITHSEGAIISGSVIMGY